MLILYIHILTWFPRHYSVYFWISVFLYICFINVSQYLFTCKYVYLKIYILWCEYVCISVSEEVCIYLYLNRCVYLCIRIGVYISVYLYKCTVWLTGYLEKQRWPLQVSVYIQPFLPHILQTLSALSKYHFHSFLLRLLFHSYAIQIITPQRWYKL